MSKVEQFKPRQSSEADQAAALPCALHKVGCYVQFHCLCRTTTQPPQPPTLLIIGGPDHVVTCPHCRLEYFLDFLHFNRDDPKLQGQLGVSIKWRTTSGIVSV